MTGKRPFLKSLNRPLRNCTAKCGAFLLENKVLLVLMLLLWMERLYAMYRLGITYNLNSDDLSYFKAGLTFAQTGSITMHGVLSAQIMPGMPVLIGLFSLVFGEGKLLWFALKLLWIFMGTCSAWYIAKSVSLFAPKWCGIAAALPLLWADFTWIDNTLLTETPFLLCFCAMVYYTLQMGRTEKNKYFWLCLISYLFGLMLKANIVLYPLFALLYLLIAKHPAAQPGALGLPQGVGLASPLVHYDRKKLWKQAGILCIAVLCFVIPWSIRNYSYFQAFVPLTWGSGNPMLLGTYQGHGYPPDEQLDYAHNVDQVILERFGTTGEEGSYLRKYISLERDGVKANYRLSEWAKQNPLSLLDSYLIEKPAKMIHSVYYLENLFSVSGETILFWRDINWVLCIATVLAAFMLKKYRAVVSFLSLLYLGNIYIYAAAFSYSRYAMTLLPLRFILVGLGIVLLYDAFRLLFLQVRQFGRSSIPPPAQ